MPGVRVKEKIAFQNIYMKWKQRDTNTGEEKIHIFTRGEITSFVSTNYSSLTEQPGHKTLVKSIPGGIGNILFILLLGHAIQRVSKRPLCVNLFVIFFSQYGDDSLGKAWLTAYILECIRMTLTTPSEWFIFFPEGR